MNRTTIALAGALTLALFSSRTRAGDELAARFRQPPDSARPGVYWYFMDGNRTRKGMTDDLEAMQHAGIGHVVFLEVNVGIARGPVDFLSAPWCDLFKHAVREAERLGIEITLGSGPGWAGSGGPWVRLDQSMQHLVASAVQTRGPTPFAGVVPRPEPRQPYFGCEPMTDEMRQQWAAFYEDVAVLAFPSPADRAELVDVDEKALYYRAPYSSRPGVKPFLPAPADHPEVPARAVIDRSKILDLTAHLQPDGSLNWDVPAGNWTIMRFGRRNTGATTRPAPLPGLGFECDKFDAAALDDHFAAYVGKLIQEVGSREKTAGRGWTMLHIDSWEMGAQNWTADFRQQFRRRRGYDPLSYLPTYTGRIVGSVELSERFLWDLRMTAQELVLENHAGRLQELGRRHGFGLSIEPYDMNPTADLDLGAVADVPMCEFWSEGFGFDTSYSCFEAASIAHTHGRPVVAAEAFTADSSEAWKLYPAAVKNQGDWAFCTGINRFVYHTFAHKPEGQRPGMTMGPYGVHWDRGQTWWPLVAAYHRYIARCQFLLQQGQTVADICYLVPEGAPHVFRPPSSALQGRGSIRDRRGYNFDGCAARTLIAAASVRDHRIVFPGGAEYRLLVLPSFETMTPALLKKIKELVEAGATVVGPRPRKSPSLVGYPQCDRDVAALAATLWAGTAPPAEVVRRAVGLGHVVWGGPLQVAPPGAPSACATDLPELYPEYEATARLLAETGLPADFQTDGPIRSTHRRSKELDIYFVANRTAKPVEAACTFRVAKRQPELWDPLSGAIRNLPDYAEQAGRTAVPLRFEPQQSFFVVFRAEPRVENRESRAGPNFPEMEPTGVVEGPWAVSFDTQLGGPARTRFPTLVDWSQHSEPGIKYYSGIATYAREFDLPPPLPAGDRQILLDLGVVYHLARVRLNGCDLGVLWCAPWCVDIAKCVQARGNLLEIDVANLWPNRLIGDQAAPPDQRVARTTFNPYQANSPLLPSGLLGPVTLWQGPIRPDVRSCGLKCSHTPTGLSAP